MTVKELYDIRLNEYDTSVFEAARSVWDSIAHPLDGLGRLEEDICRIAAALNTPVPDISKKALIIFCADNGVVKEGISQCGNEVTAQVAALMGMRASSVGMMTASYPLDIFTVDVGIDSVERIDGVIGRKVRKGTGNIAVEAAMTEEECLSAISCGMDMAAQLCDEGYNIIATGEMGIGNTTTSTAMLCALCGVKPESVTGRGAGLSDEGLKKKILVIDRALALHGFDKPAELSGEYAFKALCCLGGLDIAALTGLYIGAAMHKRPVVIDGLISAVAALCAECIVEGCRNYMLASHTGKERGCSVVLDKLGLKSVIDADLALGEGSGAVLMLPMLDMAISLYNTGTAFNDTGIDSYERFKQ